MAFGKPGALPSPETLQDLATRPQVIADIRQHLRIRRRQEKQWDDANLFGGPLEDLKPRKNDHPLVQIAKQLAYEYRTTDDQDARTRYIAELSKLAQAIDRNISAHNKVMISSLLEAAKLDIKAKTSGSGIDVQNMTREEWVQHLMDNDKLSREEAEAIIDASLAAGAKEAGSDADDQDDD